MTLPLDESLPTEPQAGRTPDSYSRDETQRLVEEVIANRLRETGIKDELRRALYRRAIDRGLQRFNGGTRQNPFGTNHVQRNRLRTPVRVAVCGFAAFVVVLWALGPSTLDAVEAVLVAAGASVTLGFISLAIAALCDRIAGRHSDPADHQPMQPRKDHKALRRLF
ncbi:hypothetical protein [Dongia rigui]|uniref:DUF3040 domain-containing protein n=1 Tax=Dongia rigui TaxID=940149 RepID=A0ABU5DVM6_9PROT|nr:hypothetical protein [Dongia rigui]MDY0871329.1 hypothetical protein [Dongia rigui]